MKYIPSPQDIRRSGILGAYFFSDETLRFWGQSMRSFKTEWHDKNKDIVRLFAPSYDNEGRNVYFSTAYKHIKVTPKNRDVLHVTKDGLRVNKDLVTSNKQLLVKVTASFN